MKSKFPRAKKLEPVEILIDLISRGKLAEAKEEAKKLKISLEQKGGKIKSPAKKMMGGGKVKPKAKTKMMYGSKVKKRK